MYRSLKQAYIVLVAGLTALLPLSAEKNGDGMSSDAFEDGVKNWVGAEDASGQGVLESNALLYEKSEAEASHYVPWLEHPQVEADKVYTYEAMVKIDSPLEGGTFGLAYIPFQGNTVVGYVSGPTLTQTQGWTRIKFTSRVPDQCDVVELRLHHFGKGRVLVDDVVWRPATEAEINSMSYAKGDGTVYETFENGVSNWPGAASAPEQGVSGSDALLYDRPVAQPYHYVPSSRRRPVEPGKAYTYEAMIKIDEALKVEPFGLAFIPFQGDKALGYVRGPVVTETKGWVKLDFTSRMPDGCDSVELRLHNFGRGSVLVDNLMWRPATDLEMRRIPSYARTPEESVFNNPDLYMVLTTPMPVVKALYNDLPTGSKFAMNLYWEDSPAQAIHQTRFRTLLTTSVGKPDFKSLSFQIRPEALSGKPNLTVSLYPFEGLSSLAKDKGYFVYETTLTPEQVGKWTKIELTPANCKFVPGPEVPEDWSKIKTIHISFGSEKTAASLSFADGQVEFTNRKELLWDPSRPTGMFSSADCPEPVGVSLAADGRFMVGLGAGVMHPAEMRRLDYIKKFIPNLGVVFNPGDDWFDQFALLRNEFVKRGIAFELQQGIGRGAATYLSSRQGLSDEYDENPGTMDAYNGQHKISYTHPAARDAYVGIAAAVAKAGIPTFQAIDARYESGKYDLTRFRGALAETEPPIPMIDVQGKPFQMSFWDYLDLNYGLRWKPSDVGLNSWSDFQIDPSKIPGLSRESTIRLGLLHMALVHYEFLRFYNDLGAIFKKENLRLIEMPNGDNWQTGNHYLFNALCPNIAGLVDETHFYGPNSVLHGFHDAAMWRYVFGLARKHHRLIGEAGTGGDGEPYIHPEFAYLMWYDLNAANHYDSAESDWFHNNYTSDLAARRSLDFIMKAWGYTHAREDNPEPIPSEMVKLYRGGSLVMGYDGIKDWGWKETAVSLNLVHNKVQDVLWGTDLFKSTRVILDDVRSHTPKVAEGLTQWIHSGSKRVLILQNSAAGSLNQGLDWRANMGDPELDEPNTPTLFGFALGRVSRSGDTIPAGPLSIEGKWQGPLKIDNVIKTPIYKTESTGTMIVQAGTTPLLSRFELAGGNRVYYLHYRQSAATEVLDQAILTLIREEEGIAVSAETSKGKSYVHAYDLPGQNPAMAVAVYDAATMKAYGDTLSNGRKIFGWRNPESDVQVQLSTKWPAGTHVTVQEVLQNRQTTGVVGENGQLPLALKGVTGELFFIHTDAAEATLMRERSDKIVSLLGKYETEEGKAELINLFQGQPTTGSEQE